MHLEIFLPLDTAPKTGIRLPTGHMRREVRRDAVSFYKPLMMRDGLYAGDELNSVAIISFLEGILRAGAVFAIYDDDHDPYKNVVDVSLGELRSLRVKPNVAYRVL